MRKLKEYEMAHTLPTSSQSPPSRLTKPRRLTGPVLTKTWTSKRSCGCQNRRRCERLALLVKLSTGTPHGPATQPCWAERPLNTPRGTRHRQACSQKHCSKWQKRGGPRSDVHATGLKSSGRCTLESRIFWIAQNTWHNLQHIIRQPL